MKLYTSLNAPNPRRVHWFMFEKGIENIELFEVDLSKGGQFAPEYVALTGHAVVPALVTDSGEVFTESVAICRYLESLYPEPNMFGTTALEIATIEMWMRRTEALLVAPLMVSMLHSDPRLAVVEPNQSPDFAARLRALAEEGEDLLEVRLATNQFIAAERITMADIVAVGMYGIARLLDIDEPPTTRPNIRRWLDDLFARPAASAGLGPLQI